MYRIRSNSRPCPYKRSPIMGSTWAHHYPHTKFHQCTIFVPIAAHTPISAHPSNFETRSHEIIKHIPMFISQEGLGMYLWGFWGVDSRKNIEMNKRTPLMTLLSALGSYWNEYGNPYRTLDIWLFLLLANQNRYANEVLNMHIRCWQTTWVVLMPTTTHMQSLMKIGHCILIWERRFTFDVDEIWHTYTHPSVGVYMGCQNNTAVAVSRFKPVQGYRMSISSGDFMCRVSILFCHECGLASQIFRKNIFTFIMLHANPIVQRILKVLSMPIPLYLKM